MKSFTALVVLGLLLVGCAKEDPKSDMKLSSSAFQQRGAIPKRFTCSGENISPPLSWSDAPAGTRSFALVVDDPDAKHFIHWLLFNIPAKVSSLPEGVKADSLPQGAVQGTNDFNAVGYGGPCPPKGRHRYSFRLYALDVESIHPESARKDAFDASVRGHILTTAELLGYFER